MTVAAAASPARACPAVPKPSASMQYALLVHSEKRMKQIFATALAAILAAGSALAQTDNPFNGSWTIAFDGKKTIDLDGTVVISGTGGSWDIVAQSRKNPCVGRAYPITVQKATADELSFTVNRAVTLAGCKDSTYTFKKVDEKTLTGELADGRTASLTRK